MRALALSTILTAAFLLGLADDAFAGGRGGRGFGHSGRGFSHGGHFHSGVHTRVFIGGAFVAAPLLAYPYYYAPAPAYYYPPPVYPPVYQEPAPYGNPAPSSQQYWYYCPPARAYYPYVGECPGGWQRVAPNNTPPPPAG